MGEALKLAKIAGDKGEVPIGALIVRNSDGVIVGSGENCREDKRTALGHAEIVAISSACEFLGGWRLEGCTIYVTLEPCPMCAGAIINARIDRVVFGAFDEKNGAVGSVTNLFEEDFTHKPNITSGILQEECSSILADFFKKLRENRNSTKKVAVKTPDQIKRLELMLQKDGIDYCGEEYYFLRKNGKIIGYEQIK